MRVHPAALCWIGAVAVLVTGCATYRPVDVPVAGGPQAQPIALEPGTEVRIVLRDGGEIEREVLEVDGEGILVRPRYGKPEPQERIEYRAITSIERFDSAGVVGNAGLSVLALCVLSAILVLSAL